MSGDEDDRHMQSSPRGRSSRDSLDSLDARLGPTARARSPPRASPSGGALAYDRSSLFQGVMHRARPASERSAAVAGRRGSPGGTEAHAAAAGAAEAAARRMDAARALAESAAGDSNLTDMVVASLETHARRPSLVAHACWVLAHMAAAGERSRRSVLAAGAVPALARLARRVRGTAGSRGGEARVSGWIQEAADVALEHLVGPHGDDGGDAQSGLDVVDDHAEADSYLSEEEGNGHRRRSSGARGHAHYDGGGHGSAAARETVDDNRARLRGGRYYGDSSYGGGHGRVYGGDDGIADGHVRRYFDR